MPFPFTGGDVWTRRPIVGTGVRANHTFSLESMRAAIKGSWCLWNDARSLFHRVSQTVLFCQLEETSGTVPHAVRTTPPLLQQLHFLTHCYRKCAELSGTAVFRRKKRTFSRLQQRCHLLRHVWARNFCIKTTNHSKLTQFQPHSTGIAFATTHTNT